MFVFAAVGLPGVGPLTVQAADEKPAAAAAEFVPPSDARPAKRVGGVAIRCPVDAELYVSVLAPLEAAGSTTREQPTIYWYLSKPTDKPIEIAITDLKDKSNIVLDATLDNGVGKPGVQKLDHATHKAKLEPDGEYEVAIAVITDDTTRSKNAHAVCRIKCLKPGTIPAPPKDAKKPELAVFYAKRGVWFDYIATLLDAIHENPNDKTLLPRLGASLKKEKLIWKEDGNIDELVK
jgi:hypothetical protein